MRLLFLAATVLAQETPSGKFTNSFPIQDSAASLRDAIPRFTGPDHFDDSPEYWKNLAILAGLCGGLAILTLVIMICFCCGRYVLDSCGGLGRRREGYKNTERFIPFGVLLCGLLVVCAFGAVGLAGNDQLSTALTDEQTGLTTSILQILEDVQGLHDDATAAIEDAEHLIPSTVQRVNLIIDNTDQLVNDSSQLVTELEQFAEDSKTRSTYTATAPDGSTVEYTCEDCLTFSQDSEDALDEVRAELDPRLQELSAATADVRTSMDDVEADMTQELGDVRKRLNDSTHFILGRESKIKEHVDTAKSLDGWRHIVVGLLFSFPVLMLTLSLVGVFLQKGVCFKWVWILLFVNLILSFVLLGIHLTSSVVLADTCLEVAYYETRLNETDWNDDVVLVLEECALSGGNPSLAEIFDIANVTYDDNVNYPTLPMEDANVALQELDQLYSSVSNTSALHYGVPSDGVQQAVDGLNTLVQQVYPDRSYTRDTYNDPVYTPTLDSNDAAFVTAGISGEVSDAVAGVDFAIAVEQDVENVVNGTQAQMDQIMDEANVLQTGIVALNDDIQDIQDISKDMDVIIAGFTSSTRCGFLGDNYRVVKESWCNDIVSAVTLMSMAYFIVSLVSVVCVPLAIITMKRIENAYDPSVLLHEPEHTTEGGKPTNVAAYTGARTQMVQLPRPKRYQQDGFKPTPEFASTNSV